MLLFALLPASWRPYAKAVVAALGSVLQVAAVTIPGAPDWLAVAVAFMTALGVLAQPNADANGNGIPDHLEDAVDAPVGRHAA